MKPKFRAWDVKECKYDKNYHIMIDLYGNIINMQTGEIVYIIEQFSERYDINALEVYAGDIVRFFYGNSNLYGTSEVVFHNGAFCVFSEENKPRPILYYKLEIIGNIHKGVKK